MFSAAGIVFSFLVLASAAIAIKSAGMAVGWGIQFQQPLFLISMVVLVTLFSANLWGFYEIHPPEWLNLGGLFDRRGEDHTHSYGGHFTTGAFATLLATPCSAPFLGTAVGFGLSRGAFEIVLIFLFLGLGMAAPYLAIAAFPTLASKLPRPGRWMLRVKHILGGALAATALWLLVVLTATIGLVGSITVGGLMLAALVLFWARGKVAKRFRALDKAAAVGLVVAAFLTPQVMSPPTPDPDTQDSPATSLIAWKPFDLNELARLVSQEGKLVLVDVTADWCITCKINKAAVLNTESMAQRLSEMDVVALQADWTRPDEAIADYLAGFGRYGIPFNAVYGPSAPAGIPLSELLSEQEIIEALNKAK